MTYAQFAPNHGSRSILEAQNLEIQELTAGDKRAKQSEEERVGETCFTKPFGINARDGGRTRTPLAGLRILSPVRLPVPPPRLIEN